MPEYNQKINGLSLQQLKKEIKERHQSEVYRKVFNIGSKGGAPTSAMQMWKNKYLFPYGNIASINDFDRGLQTTKASSNVVNPFSKSEMDKDLETRQQEKLFFSKYRLQISDMGGLHKCAHWVEELKKPLVITQNDVGNDLTRFVIGFPMESIPYKSDQEKKIQNLKYIVTKLGIQKLTFKKQLEDKTITEEQYGEKMEQVE